MQILFRKVFDNVIIIIIAQRNYSFLKFYFYLPLPISYRIQEQIDMLPDLLSKCLNQYQDRLEQRRNFLHPDMAANSSPASLQAAPSVVAPPPLVPPAPQTIGSPLLPHSR